MPYEGVKVAQINDSEWVSPIDRFLGFLAIGSTAGYITHETLSFAKSARSNTYDSHNVAGGNMGGNTAGENVAGRDVTTSSIPTTTTTTTEVK
jgi:hypothetical protein